MPVSSSRQGLLLVCVVLAVVGLLGLAILYFFDPARFGYYPVCLFHRTTGLLCPGCGGLRAIHQLLHGNVAAAFHLNALFVLSLPVLVFVAARFLFLRLRGRAAAIEVRPFWIWTGFVLLVLFGIIRNLVSLAI